jgi:hypothetical protein
VSIATTVDAHDRDGGARFEPIGHACGSDRPRHRRRRRCSGRCAKRRSSHDGPVRRAITRFSVRRHEAWSVPSLLETIDANEANGTAARE